MSERLFVVGAAAIAFALALMIGVAWVETPRYGQPSDSGFVRVRSAQLEFEIDADHIRFHGVADFEKGSDLREGLSRGASLAEVASRALYGPGLAVEGAGCRRTSSMIDADDVSVTAAEASRLSVSSERGWPTRRIDDEVTICLHPLSTPSASSVLRVALKGVSLRSVTPTPTSIEIRPDGSDLEWEKALPPEVVIRLDVPQLVALQDLPFMGLGDLSMFGPVATILALLGIAAIRLIIPAGLLWARSAISTDEGEQDGREYVDRLVTIIVILVLASTFSRAIYYSSDALRTLESQLQPSVIVDLSGPIWFAAGVTVVVGLVCLGIGRSRHDSTRVPLIGTGAAALLAAGLRVLSTLETDPPAWAEATIRLGTWLITALLIYLVLQVIVDAITWLRWRRPAGRPITAFLIGIALILGAPSGSIVPGQSPPVWTQAQVVVESAVALLSILVPVMALLAAVILVRSYWGDRRWETLAPKDGREVHPRLGIRLLSALLFTAFVVGPDGFFFGLPLTLALAWAVVPRLLLRDTQVETLAERAAKIRRTRRSTIPIWVEKPGPSPAAGAPPPKVDRRQQDSPFALGPYARPWHNAFFGASSGALLAGVPLIVFVALAVPQIVGDDSPLLTLRLTLSVIATLATWIGIGFVFGLTYESVIGATGIRKGLRMGILAALVLAPFAVSRVLLTDADSLSSLADPVLMVAFLGSLGFMFDLRLTHRFAPSTQGVRNTVEKIGETSGLREVTAVVVAIGAAVVLQLQTLVGDQISTWLQSGLAPPVPPT